MKKTLVILLASTALIAGIGLPAWSAMHGAGLFEGPRDAALTAFRNASASPMLVSDDDSADLKHSRSLQRGGDDDEHGASDEEDDDDSDGGNASGPAPAGSVAPPSNGLFGTGATPKVQVN